MALTINHNGIKMNHDEIDIAKIKKFLYCDQKIKILPIIKKISVATAHAKYFKKLLYSAKAIDEDIN